MNSFHKNIKLCLLLLFVVFSSANSQAFQAHDQNLGYTHPAIVVKSGVSYISLRDVPTGVIITDTSYWTEILNTAPSDEPGDPPTTEPDNSSDSSLNPPDDSSSHSNYSNLGLEIYNSTKAYAQGSAVVPNQNQVDIYFAKTLVPIGENSPPNLNYWLTMSEYLAQLIPSNSEIGEPPSNVSVNLSDIDSLSIPIDDEKELFYYNLTVTIESNGSVSGGGSIEAGKNATLKATPAYGYEFLYWYFSESEIFLENPYTFTPNKNHSIRAVFKKRFSHEIIITSENEGEFFGEGTYFDGESVSLAVLPHTDYKFLHWESEGNQFFENPWTFTADQNLSVTAKFEDRHQISISSDHDGEFLGEGRYFIGDSVTLEVTPRYGYRFSYWETNGNQFFENPWTFNSTGDLAVKVIFELLPKYSLNLSHTNGGTTSGGGSFPEGENVSINATPEGGYLFYQWLFDNKTSNSNPLNLVVDQDLNITAIFKRFWILTIAESSGGSTSGNLIRSVTDGTPITLEADPALGYVFQNWTGDLESSQNPFTFSPTSDLSLKPNFAKDLSDSDQDGISNHDEIKIHKTNPLSSDSDGDGIPDNLEIEYNLDPTVSDLSLIKAIQLQKEDVSKPFVNGWFYTQELGWGWTSTTAHPNYFFKDMDGEKKWINPYEKSEETTYNGAYSTIAELSKDKIISITEAKLSEEIVKSETNLKEALSAAIETEFDIGYGYDYPDLVRIGFSEIESLALMESNFDKNKALFLVDELNATPEQILAWAIDHKSFYTLYPEFTGHRFTPIEVLALVHLNFSISEILRFSDKYSASQIIEFEKNPLLGWPVDVFEDLIPIW